MMWWLGYAVANGAISHAFGWDGFFAFNGVTLMLITWID